MGWADGPMLGFDTETTGVDVDHDRIVTAALVRRDAGGTHVTTWLIDPGVEIPEGAAAIHGITTAHAREHGVQPADALEEIADTIARAMLAGTPVVAYNAAYDLQLLEAELRRHGLDTLHHRLGGFVAPVIDPLVLDRAVDRYRPGKRKLVDLCAFYGVVDHGSLHSADADVIATLDVLGRLVACHPHLGAMDLDRLYDAQVGAHRRWAESFNEWLVRQGFDREAARTGWPYETTAVRPLRAPGTGTAISA